MIVESPTDNRLPLNVLVVDDNQDAADTLASLLKLWGHQVRVTYNGLTAVQATIESPYDCVFLDINMPVMDGYEVALKIRQRPALQGMKLIALTAYSDEEHIKRIWEVGFDYYLNKICGPHGIKRVLEMYGKKGSSTNPKS
jgi:two-component system, OmpR family, response regulator